MISHDVFNFTIERTDYEDCVIKMPAGKRIGYYRADSACYQSALINRLERDNVRFAIAAHDCHGTLATAACRRSGCVSRAKAGLASAGKPGKDARI